MAANPGNGSGDTGHAIAPLPQGTDKAPNLNGWAHLDKVTEYRPVDDAGRVGIPLLVIDAEREELFDRHRAGELAIMRARANGARAEYRVIPGISHYDIYRGAFDEPAEMARERFNGCLKDSSAAPDAVARRLWRSTARLPIPPLLPGFGGVHVKKVGDLGLGY